MILIFRLFVGWAPGPMTRGLICKNRMKYLISDNKTAPLPLILAV